MSKKIGGYLLAIVCLLAATYGVQYMMEQRSSAGVREEVTETVDDIMAEAHERSPGAADTEATEAISQVSLEQIELKMASNSMDLEKQSQKRRTAIKTFTNFYYLNTVARPEYCRKFGVEIPTFVQAFKGAHNEELAISLAYGVDMNNRFRNPKTAAAMNESTKGVIERDMQGLAQKWGVSEAKTCEAVNKLGIEMAEAIQFSKSAPEALAAMRQ